LGDEAAQAAEDVGLQLTGPAQMKVMFCAVLLIAAIVLPSSARATININVDAIQKAVVFLYAATQTGEVDKSRPIGTGFLIGMPSKDGTKTFRALVSARHLFDPTWAKCGTENPKLIYARINKRVEDGDRKKSAVEFVPVRLIVDGKEVWLHHADAEVDAAIAPVEFDDAKLDIALISVRDFPTDQEEAQQAIGDSVVSAGLLPGLPGTLRNYPIFKFGQISNIPDESIETGCGPPAPRFPVKVWLIAANLVSGNSGSPVFHLPGGGSGLSFGGRAMLLGIQSFSYAGSDVAGMTPIKFVYEILQGKAFEDADLERGPAPPAKPADPK
jgi:hypothetical protein